MNKIILSLVSIFAVAVLATGATVAYFSDTETSTGNTFAAGTLDLNLDGANTNIVKFNLSNLKPGDLGTAYWIVKNVGTVDGFLDLENKTVTNLENTCLEPETGDTTCGGGTDQGELGANIHVDLFEDVNHDGHQDAEDTFYYSGTLDGLASAVVADKALNASVEKYISLNWSIDSGVGNIIQSDGSTLDMTFELLQNAD